MTSALCSDNFTKINDEFITPPQKSVRQGILADFFKTIITWARSGHFGHILCSKCLSCHGLSDGQRNILILALFVPVVGVQTG